MPSANASLQLNQLFSDPTLAGAAKKGGLNFAGLLGDPAQTSASTVQAFQNLLSSVLVGKTSTDTLLGAKPSATIAASPELTLEDVLKGLPPEVAALLRAQAVLQSNGIVLDQGVDGNSILDASVTTIEPGKTPELFVIIDDPELAAALAGLTAQINALKIGSVPMSAVQGNLQQVVLSPAVLEAAEKIKAHIAGISDKTITIASLDGDGFQALKKIAFADIAPFLTQPRTVVVDGRTVGKIAQGPSFLNDEGVDLTTLVLNSGLVPALPLEQVTQQQPLTFGTSATPATPQQIITGAEVAAPALTVAAAVVAPAVQPAKQTANGPAAKTTAAEGEIFIPTGLASQAGLKSTPTAAAGVPASAQAVAVHQALAAAGVNTYGASDSTSRGFGDIISDFAQAAHEQLKVSADSDTSGVLKPGEQSVSSSATSLMTARSAGQSHPSTHLVSVALQRNLDPRTPGTERSFTIHMEPGNLGRVRVTLEFGENNTVKAKLMAERPETLSLLQKDIGMLDKTLNSNGFDTSSADTFSFDLAEGDSFSQAMHEGSDQQGQKNKTSGDGEFGTDDAVIENVMTMFVDPDTGLTHVNITV